MKQTRNGSKISDSDMQQPRWPSIFRMLSLDGVFQFWKACGLEQGTADNQVIHSAAKKAYSDSMGEEDDFYMINYSPETIYRVVDAFLERLTEKLEPGRVERFIDWALNFYCHKTEDGRVEWFWSNSLLDFRNQYSNKALVVNLPQERIDRLVELIETGLVTGDQKIDRKVEVLRRPRTAWDEKVYQQSASMSDGLFDGITLLMQNVLFHYWWHREVVPEFSDEEMQILLEWHKMQARIFLPEIEDRHLILPEIKLPL